MVTGISTLRISARYIDDILGWAEEAGQVECCGLMFGEAGEITRVQHTANVASDTRNAFEIDPTALIAAEKASRNGDVPVIGYFHSHPHGDATPSITDAEMALPDGRFWLIAANREVKGWRALAAGPVHCRFEPVDLIDSHSGLAIARLDRH